MAEEEEVRQTPLLPEEQVGLEAVVERKQEELVEVVVQATRHLQIRLKAIMAAAQMAVVTLFYRPAVVVEHQKLGEVVGQ